MVVTPRSCWHHVAASQNAGRLMAIFLTSAIAGGIGYSGLPVGLAFAPLFALSWGLCSSRKEAFWASAVYYLLAGRGLYHGGGVFFAGVESSFSRSLAWGAFVWIVPSALLASTWALCWSIQGRSLRLCICLVLLSVPPIGIIGWASPVAASGIWFPHLGWSGLIGMMGLLAALTHTGEKLSHGVLLRRAHLSLFGLPIALAVGANVTWVEPSAPKGWVAVNTHLGSTDGWDALDSVQSKLGVEIAAGSKVLLFPEAVGGDWSINKLYWSRIEKDLTDSGVTAIVGADRELDRRRHVNALMTIGKEGGQEWPERAPVPLGMWNPLSSTRHVVSDWAAPGVRRIDGVDAAYLICYEQLLVWPVLRSVAVGSQVIVGASNLWWAKDTSIPEIQHTTLYAWARLFGEPMLLAVNE